MLRSLLLAAQVPKGALSGQPSAEMRLGSDVSDVSDLSDVSDRSDRWDGWDRSDGSWLCFLLLKFRKLLTCSLIGEY